MNESTAKQFLLQHPGLFWDAAIRSTISSEYIVDRILQYGDISDIKDCIKLIGEEAFKDQIRFQLGQKMIQYHPSTIRFLNHIFSLYDSVSLGDIVSRAKSNTRVYR